MFIIKNRWFSGWSNQCIGWNKNTDLAEWTMRSLDPQAVEFPHGTYLLICVVQFFNRCSDSPRQQHRVYWCFVYIAFRVDWCFVYIARMLTFVKLVSIVGLCVNCMCTYITFTLRLLIVCDPVWSVDFDLPRVSGLSKTLRPRRAMKLRQLYTA